MENFEKIVNELLHAGIKPGDKVAGTREKPEKPINGSQGFIFIDTMYLNGLVTILGITCCLIQ
jgi:hypothetical protein